MDLSRPALRGIVFDKDGCLFDFEATWAAWTADLLCDLAPDPAALGEVLGFDLAARRFHPHSPVIAGTPAEIAALMAPYVDHSDLEGLLNARAAAARQVEVVPLRPLFEGLRGPGGSGGSGLRLGVMTNDGAVPAAAHLAHVGDLLDPVIGSDSGHGAKPDGAPLRHIARLWGLPPGACAMVGDSTHDLIAARAAGMRPVAVLTGPAGRADLAPLAEVVLPSIAALPDWVAGQATQTPPKTTR
ncbi:MAG: HAD family hydrolase [Shimia sp.]